MVLRLYIGKSVSYGQKSVRPIKEQREAKRIGTLDVDNTLIYHSYIVELYIYYSAVRNKDWPRTFFAASGQRPSTRFE